MYNSQFVCTYSFYDSKLRDFYHNNERYDLEDVKDFEDLSDLVYKTDLLRAMQFTIDEIKSSGDNVCFNSDKLLQLYDVIKIDAEFMECVEKSREKHICEDSETGFITLFSYDYFFLTHKCICDIINEGKTSSDNISRLKQALE
jgi:hypothetical protein